jgi:fructose-1,6-bisphosphatase/inositol monophosphatase family enzyme
MPVSPNFASRLAAPRGTFRPVGTNARQPPQDVLDVVAEKQIVAAIANNRSTIKILGEKQHIIIGGMPQNKLLYLK